MLRWWIGGGSASNLSRDEDSPDYPETPAPVFAARAFKSAIFGTPAPKDEDTFEIAKSENTAARESRPRSGSMSPTKRGILMTPGTATSRRKTVTFGANLEQESKRESKSGIPDDCPGKFPSPWVSKTEDDLSVMRSTNLLKTLEDARESTKKATKSSSDQPAVELPPTQDTKLQSSLPPELDLRIRSKQKRPRDVEPEKTRQETHGKAEDADIDFTYDLNEPRSQSGRHWKRQYEKFREEAQERMGHLIRYKELAKSFAKMKDDEAMDMREKLEREQQHVISMENYIARLIGEIEDRNKSGDSDTTPELTKELSRQTALATQYKEQVEQFRATLEKRGVLQPGSGVNGDTASRTERALLEARRDLQKAREQIKETTSLRDEAKKLRLDLLLSERKTEKLSEENIVLAQRLEKCKADLERSERARKTLEEQSKKRGDILRTLQKDYESLKRLANKHRSDADLQLQQRREQITTLRKEFLSTRYVADSSESEKLVRTLQQKIAAHDKIVQEYEAQIARLRSQELKELGEFNLESNQTQPKRNSTLRKVFGGSSNRIVNEKDSYEQVQGTDVDQPGDDTRELEGIGVGEHRDDTQEQDQTINVDHLLESVTPELRTPKAKREYAQKENRSMLPKYTHSTTPFSSPLVLADITNSPSKRTVPENDESANLVATPGLSKRFSDLSLQSPAISFEESPISRGPNRNRLSGNNNSKASPRPSMFSMENTLVKSRQLPNFSRGAQGSSRASSLANGGRTRAALPPDRAAAAKARIEHRNREKQQRRMQEVE